MLARTEVPAVLPHQALVCAQQGGWGHTLGSLGELRCLANLRRDNLDQDLLPWQPSAARSGPLTALDFLNL